MTAPDLQGLLAAIRAAPRDERCVWLLRAEAWASAAWNAIVFHGCAENGWARHPDADRGWDRLAIELRAVTAALCVEWW